MKITVATGTEKKKIEKWEVEDAMRTLMRAREIRLNPELMALVQKEAKKQKAAIKSIADLKSAYNRAVDLKVQPKVEAEEDDLNDDEDEKELEAMIQAE